MLKIRLMKPGKSIKGRTHYKIVVTEAKAARDSKFVEQLGLYDPSHQLLRIDIALYDKWYKVGAKPSDTVASLYKKCKKQAQAK